MVIQIIAKYWSFSFIISPSNAYSGLISFDWLVWSTCNRRDSQEFSPTPQFKRIMSSKVQSSTFDCTLQFPKGLCKCPNVQVTSWSYEVRISEEGPSSQYFLKLSSSFNVKPRFKITYLLSLFKIWLEGQLAANIPARLAYLTMVLLDMQILITFSRLPKWL